MAASAIGWVRSSSASRVAVLVALLVVLVAQGLLALADDVHLEVHAGDLRLDARRLLDVVVLVLDGRDGTGGRALGRLLGGRGEVGGGGGLGGALLGLRDGLVGDRLLARLLAGRRRLLRADGVLRRDLVRLVDLALLLVGHRVMISSLVGFCASCGCSGPA